MLELLDAHYMSQYEAQCLSGTSPTMPHPTFHHQLELVKWIPFSFYVARLALRHHTHNATSPQLMTHGGQA